MRLEAGPHAFEWIEGWAELPPTDGWAHTGVAVLPSGEVLTGDPAEAAVVVLGPDGQRRGGFPTDLVEVHGLSLAGDGLWIADIGRKRRPDAGYEYVPARPEGRVVKYGLDGQRLVELPHPDHPAYRELPYSPTLAVEAPDGAVWVADGYGASLVHRYDRAGRHAATLEAELACPHALLIDDRRDEPELYVADRSNRRLQVFDLAGRRKRVVGAEFLTGPTNLALMGDILVIAEHVGSRLTLLDLDDRLIGHLGADPDAGGAAGWPNRRDGQGRLARPPLAPGRFNSPHGLAADPDGNLYVSEWLIGGRLVKLARRG